MKIGNLEVYGVIYKITNKVNGKVYIGQTINNKGFRGRYAISKKKIPIIGVYKHHKYLLEKIQKGCNEHLLNSISKYGYDSWGVSEIFDVAFSKCELDIKEKFWISLYNSTNNKYGYNKESGGSNGKPNKESREKMKSSQFKNGHTRRINQLSIPDLKIIKTYNSILSATNDIGLSRSSIKNVLNPKYQANTAGGYAWEYCDFKNIKYEGEIYFDIAQNKIIRGSPKKKDKLKKTIINKNKRNEIRNLKPDNTAIVVSYLNQKMNIDEISQITGIRRVRVYQIAHSYELIPIKKQKEINKEAELTRCKVLSLHLEGFRNYEIQNKLNLSKSIVEKAIDKYKKNIIDKCGKYIKINK